MRSKKSRLALKWLLVLLVMTPIGLGAQQTAGDQGAGTGQSYVYSQEQLDQLLAPIALYPDTLLSQILMASTYPLEVVQADRWLKQNPNLTGDALDEALKNMNWDVSVKSLCHFPETLSMMDDRLQQTTDLGNAFLSQQDQVMDTVQKLRARAQAQGNLKSTPQQRVSVEDNDIVIEPAYPDVISVPYYDPCWVYGPWWYPTCAPLWFWYPGIVVDAGFFWGPRIFVGPIGFWCGFNWHRHSIFVDVNRTVFIDRFGPSRMHGGREFWQHNPDHRKGVAYRDNATARRFGRPGWGPGVDARRSFRGFTPQGRGGAMRTQPEARPEMRPGRVESHGIQRQGVPSGSRGLGQPRSGGAFHGFGRGIESQLQSERGRQSLSGGIHGRMIPSPGSFGRPGGSFSGAPGGGFHPGGGMPRGGGFGGAGPGGGGHMGGGHRGR